jgi:hypothetical protein
MIRKGKVLKVRFTSDTESRLQRLVDEQSNTLGRDALGYDERAPLALNIWPREGEGEGSMTTGQRWTIAPSLAKS